MGQFRDIRLAAGLLTWFKEQVQRIPSENDFESIDASLRIFATIAKVYGGTLAWNAPVEAPSIFIDNLSAGKARAVAAALALFVSVANYDGQKRIKVWRPTPSQIAQITSVLQERSTPKITIQALAYMIEEAEDQRAVEPLIPWLGNSDRDLRESVASALLAIGTPVALSAVALRAIDVDAGLRRLALGAKAKSAGKQGAELALLTKDLDGRQPFLDPEEPITVDLIQRASAKLDLSAAEVRDLYLLLAEPMGLRIERDESRPLPA